MFEPPKWILEWFISLVPTRFRFKFPKFNYIMVHYCYLLGWSIVGSIILYPGGIMAYIDALFFAAGAATQSGLNTINLNDLYLYQQVTLFFMANVCNPIFINTMVVFARLYWFEKRFKKVVKEAKMARKNKTWSRTRSEMRNDPEDGKILNHSIQGRDIIVLHETTTPNGMSGNPTTPAVEKEMEKMMGIKADEHSVETTPEGSNQSSSSTARDDDDMMRIEKSKDMSKPSADSERSTHLGLPLSLSRDIKFVDELNRPQVPDRQRQSVDSDAERSSEENDVSHHVAFVQRQQKNSKSGATLRIPGPRDFERGEMPQELTEEDKVLRRTQTQNTLTTILSSEGQSRSRPVSSRMSGASHSEHLNDDDHPIRKGITIDAPDHPRHQQQMDRERESTQIDTDNEGRMAHLLHKVTSPLRRRHTEASNNGPDGARPGLGRTLSQFTTWKSIEKSDDPMPYLSWQPTIGRNSAFVGLTSEQREELGGIEYRSLKLLAKILVCYFVGFHTLGMTVLLPWIMRTRRWRVVVQEDGIDSGWWGVFTPASLFNDLGFTLTPDSMISFQTATLPLLFGSFLILIGNTGFPCMLRFVIWVLSKVVSYGSPIWEELRFLLDHPRRCFILLFPSKATWWLFWVLIGLNVIDLVFFIILDINDSTVTSIPGGYRVLAGWFQAASTRTAGFSCVNLADLHPAIQVSYLIMMYISVFPIAISVRRTNVYEEKSLGVYSGDDTPSDEDASYVGQHLRRQLSFDLWYVFLGFFIICIVEGGRLEDVSKYAFNMFAVLFEIVSAYGTVGLSLGYPGYDTSFSAQFRVISKLVIIAMMIRGRHRGLPYALDRAILLPSEKLHKKEAEQAFARTGTIRRNSVFSDPGLEAPTDEDAMHRYRRTRTWKDGDLDENGLPREAENHSEGPMTAAAGGIVDEPSGTGAGNATGLERQHTGITFAEPSQRRHIRRNSTFSTVGADGDRRPRHARRRSITSVIAGGLSAGPTISKHDD